jgi:hypothetical protein
MANREAKERNRAQKGRTGPMTVNQRKKRGLKARPNKASKTKGKKR